MWSYRRLCDGLKTRRWNGTKSACADCVRIPVWSRSELFVAAATARVHRGQPALPRRAGESAKADFVRFQRRVSNPA
jgi:hypothetical protein